MSLFKNVIYKMCLEIIYLMYMYKKNLALNHPQQLIYHKIQPTQPLAYKALWIVINFLIFWSICLSSFRVHSKNVSGSLKCFRAQHVLRHTGLCCRSKDGLTSDVLP